MTTLNGANRRLDDLTSKDTADRIQVLHVGGMTDAEARLAITAAEAMHDLIIVISYEGQLPDWEFDKTYKAGYDTEEKNE